MDKHALALVDKHERYELVRQLGCGGMGDVFLARDVAVCGTERLVVLKCARKGHLVHGAAKTLLNEARISMRLNHPNIAHIYDVGQHDGDLFLVMEYVEGVDLRQLMELESRPLTPALAAFVAAQIAEALSYAHTLEDLSGSPLRIVHRDLNPKNIRISRTGLVKVLDFGIAKARDNVDETAPGVLKGTLPYLSPEQLRGPSQIDARTDLFALGVVLHEMLTHRRLFKRDNAWATLHALMQQPIARPSAVSPSVPIELDRITLKLLERDASQRYQTARDVLGDLKRYLRTIPADTSDLAAVMEPIFATSAERSPSNEDALAPTDAVESASLIPPPSNAQEPPTDAVTGPSPPSAYTATVSMGTPQRGSGSSSRTEAEAGSLTSLLFRHQQARWPWILAASGLAIGVVVLRVPSGRPPIEQVPRAPAPPSPTPRQTPVVAMPPTRVSSAVASADPRAAVAEVRLSHASERSVAAAPDDDGPQTPLGKASQQHVRKSRPRRRHKRPHQVSQHEQKGPASRQAGRVTIDTVPWAIVYIDGQRVGATPIANLVLPAGQHQLHLHNPDRGLSRQLTIRVPSNGVLRKRFEL